jgi:hypothetical protein
VRFVFQPIGKNLSLYFSSIENNNFAIIYQDKFIKRKRIEAVAYNSYHGVIFVSAGLEGIDIYQFDEYYDL